MIGRLIGIDHGIKRIGLAVSDAMGITARELIIIHRTTDLEDFERIQMIARRQQAVGFVIGIPQNPNAPAGLHTQADAVRRWLAQFQKHTHLPIATVGEYLTSAEARQLARQRSRSPKAPVDDLAARIILQSYLDALSYGGTVFPPPLTDE